MAASARIGFLVKQPNLAPCCYDFLHQGAWLAAGWALWLLALVGRSFLGLRRVMRYGQLTRVVATERSLLCLKGTLMIDGAEHRVDIGVEGFDAETLLDAWGAVEMRVLYDEKRLRKAGGVVAIAVRPASPDNADLLRAPLPKATATLGGAKDRTPDL